MGVVAPKCAQSRRRMPRAGRAVPRVVDVSARASGVAVVAVESGAQRFVPVRCGQCGVPVPVRTFTSSISILVAIFRVAKSYRIIKLVSAKRVRAQHMNYILTGLSTDSLSQATRSIVSASC